MNLKNKRGITLIALVITIIILLILAGITIVALTGDNGLFARAQQAKETTKNAQEKENFILGSYENGIKNIDNSSREIEGNSAIITGVEFEVKNTSSTYIELTISITASNEEDVLGYHIIAINANDNSQVSSKITTEKDVKLEGLKANSKYNIFVAAYDKYNKVKYSQNKTIQTCSEFDFTSRFEKLSVGKEGKYYGLSGEIAGFDTTIGTSYLKNEKPFLYISDTNSYANFYTVNKLEQNFKSIEIYTRTRNDGNNNASLKWGLVSNTGNSPTWLEGATDSVTCATTSDWKDYKATIEIPKGINTKDYYLQMYFKHNGSSFSMAIEFVSFKGIY